VGGDLARRGAVGDLEQRGSLLAHVRLGVAGAGIFERTPLLDSQNQ
jgi:hypothetical protein